MPQTIPLADLKQGLLYVLDECFEDVHGVFLDRGTSIFETLAGVDAATASRPVSSRCASIAAQVEHMAFYLDVLMQFLRGEPPEKVDWSVAWTKTEVDGPAWEARQAALRQAYDALRAHIQAEGEAFTAPNAVGGTFGVVAHCAYHLGEIRQALCTLGPEEG
jgi:hypothetical protein